MFGAVEIKKRYVSYHLMPLYLAPEGALTVSEQLRRRKQGKACFNFTRVDEDLFAELSDLTRRSVAVAETSPFTGLSAADGPGVRSPAPPATTPAS
jgi:hypothetical protein